MYASAITPVVYASAVCDTRRMDTYSVRDARRQFTDLINRVHYGQAQVRISRHGKVMARLVSDSFMQRLERLVADDPKIADKLQRGLS